MGNEHKKGRANQNRVGMYFSLSVCVVAILLGSVSAIKNKNDLYNNVAVTTKEVVEIRKNQTDVTKQTTVTTQTTTKTTTQTTTSIVANHFVMPVGGKLNKEFSNQKMQYCETYGDWRLHLGIDIAAKKGSDVVSAGKGKVKKVYVDDLFGKVVVIDHGNGVQTRYYHMKKGSLVVKAGQKVSRGQPIGQIGATGYVTGAHLHFEIRVNGKSINPMSYLK